MTVAPKEIARLMSLGRRIAFSVARLVPLSIDVDDLVAAANLGLADALARGDKSDERFVSYATIRMRGAVMDELRARDPLSREDRELAGRRSRVEALLSQGLGRAPELVEVADVLGVSANKLDELDQTYAAGHSQASLDDALDVEECYDLDEQFDRHGVVARALADLPERWRVVLELYFESDWTAKRIGEALGISESRIDQIRWEALKRMRSDRRIEELRR